MWRCCAIFMAVTLLAGCGLGETAATATAAGASGAEAARQAKETQVRIQEQIEEAQRKAAEQRRAIDEGTGE